MGLRVVPGGISWRLQPECSEQDPYTFPLPVTNIFVFWIFSVRQCGLYCDPEPVRMDYRIRIRPKMNRIILFQVQQKRLQIYRNLNLTNLWVGSSDVLRSWSAWANIQPRILAAGRWQAQRLFSPFYSLKAKKSLDRFCSGKALVSKGRVDLED